MNSNISSPHILKLKELFFKYYDVYPERIERLPGAGSARIYYRLEGAGIRCIGTVSENIDDSRGFVNLSCIFRNNAVNVPEVYAFSEDYKYYIQQDLGSESLFDIIGKIRKSGGADIDFSDIVKKSIDQLVRVQNIDIKELERNVTYPPFSRRQVMWDLNYFKYEYLKPSGFDFDENALEDDFDAFAEELINIEKSDRGFMYRDFQSRNIIIKDNEPWLIDFQGGRIGSRIYDIVSFLWQAKAGFSKIFRKEMIEYYREKSGIIDMKRRGITPMSSLDFNNSVMKMALFRTLQVLGAYGLRGLVERKAHFIESIPAALNNLNELINEGVSDCYPELKKVCETICNDKRFYLSEEEGLTVTVFSFSYKKGYPSDYTGNGGGFMFDCRGMHNPGRYEEYKPFTGRDKEVIDFLEERGEVQDFTRKAIDIVSPTIDRYLQRGFNNLQIGFGCTGGRHRSVYCAERVAKDIAEKFPDAHVKLVHREHGITINLG